MARVIILQGPGAGREYELQGETVLGRLETSGIPIEDVQASREHARIEAHGDGYTIVDLGSSNGTHVNGRRIAEHRLQSGDRIVIGTVRMRFDDPDAVAEPQESEPESEGSVEATGTTQPAAGPAPESPQRVPRAFPEQYWLLLGCTAISIGCLTVWEREQVCGKDVYGFQMIVGTFTLLFAAYGVLEAGLGILRGGLRVAGAGAAGLLGLLYGFKALGRILAHEGFRSLGELAEEGSETYQEALARWAGQIGPGIWATLFGALVIGVVFTRALLTAPKKASAARRTRPS